VKSEEHKEENPLDVKELVLDVKMVSQLVVKIFAAKNKRTVKDAMTITELRCLADAAVVGIRKIPASRKPNGLTDEGQIISQLEADLAHTNLRLEEALARIDELEKNRDANIEER